MAEHRDGEREQDRVNRTSARYVISPKLIKRYKALEKSGGEPVSLRVTVELNLDHEDGRRAARSRVIGLIKTIENEALAAGTRPPEIADLESRHHVFVELTETDLLKLVELDSHPEARPPGIYKVWLDEAVEPLLDRSVRIIKADACLKSFGSDGDQIVWAVADSGIEKSHPHFNYPGYDTLNLKGVGIAPARSGRPRNINQLDHKDFTKGDSPLTDNFGHGTHVAGIIAGRSPELVAGKAAGAKAKSTLYRVTRQRDGDDVRNRVSIHEKGLQGVAPKTKLVSLKVLDDAGKGWESALLAAIDFVARVNDDGRWIRIHGLNLSLGYTFDAEWFAAGQSPLCVAVDRLVKQGVVVVAAAGNQGSAIIATEFDEGGRRIGLDQSICDPGNAEMAITVGSTHPEQPHNYGVSYFSSRGPTADGRSKPDVVAPGERILSCASHGSLERLKENDPELGRSKALDKPGAYYREESGTSMAAPHVSGAVAAFLSVRSEFIGKPERIKQILMDTATDLRRRRDFQGAGLVDLMRALQSI